jgi:hypothetical protein
VLSSRGQQWIDRVNGRRLAVIDVVSRQPIGQIPPCAACASPTMRRRIFFDYSIVNPWKGKNVATICPIRRPPLASA